MALKKLQKRPRIYVTEEEFERMQFREIPEFPNYFASYEKGLIAHRMRNGQLFLMRTPLNNVRYRQVCLRKPKDPKPYVMAVSRAVALAWVDGHDEQHNEVGHLNENGRYNLQEADNAENLVWCSRHENASMPNIVEKRRQIALDWWAKPQWAKRQVVLMREGRRKRREAMKHLEDNPLF